MSLYNHKDAENPVLPKGEYDALIVAATEHVPKVDKGNGPMRKVSVIVYNPEGGEVKLNDYLMASTAWKYKAIAKLVGQEEAFKNDAFDPVDHCDEVYCRVKLTVKEDPQYGMQNQISAYIKREDAKPVAVATPAAKPMSTPFAKRPTGAAPAPEDIQVPF